MTNPLDRFVIRVFKSPDGEQPEWVAHVWERVIIKKQESLTLLPATHFAGSSTTARERMEAFLASEIARETRLAELSAERSARARKGAA